MSTRLDKSQRELERYINKEYMPLLKNDIQGSVVFTGFRADPSAWRCIGQIWCRTKSTELGKSHAFVSIVFSNEEIHLLPDYIFQQMLQDKVHVAMERLLEIVCDPFDLEVRRIRLEAGVDATRCPLDSD